MARQTKKAKAQSEFAAKLIAIGEALQQLPSQHEFIWEPNGNCDTLRRLLFIAAQELQEGKESTALETLQLALRQYDFWMQSHPPQVIQTKVTQLGLATLLTNKLAKVTT